MDGFDGVQGDLKNEITNMIQESAAAEPMVGLLVEAWYIRLRNSLFGIANTFFFIDTYIEEQIQLVAETLHPMFFLTLS